MDKEIERKWFINKNDIPFELEKYNFADIEQAYLLYNPTIRIRKKNNLYYFTYKDAISNNNTNIERFENNIQISKEDYDRLLLSKTGLLIKKRRYLIPYDNFNIELDVFDNEYKGLIYAEVEFNDIVEAKNFVPPNWFSKELTEDEKYSNASLSKGNLLNNNMILN